MSCLTPAWLSQVRSAPTSIDVAYQACRSELVADLGPGFQGLTVADEFAIYVSLVAYQLAPYGSSLTLDLAGLLAEDALDCDNYVALAYQLYRPGPGRSSSSAGRAGRSAIMPSSTCRPTVRTICRSTRRSHWSARRASTR